jgi:hypothetical protein
MAQNKYIMPVEACCKVIDEWIAKGRDYHWAGTPYEVKEKIISQATGGWIEYTHAVRLLLEAESSKLDGLANRGMGWIKERWHLMKVKEGESHV